MADYVISSCSTADLTVEQFKEKNINYLCFNYYLDGKEYPDDMGQTMSFKDFYDAMKNGAETKTSQINVETYYNYFKSVLEQGKDVFHISFSSGLSGSYNSARLAIEDLKAEFPERKIYLVDSLAASSGLGLFIDKIAELRDSGMSIDELYTWAEKNKKRVHHWFFATDLTFFVKGGRVSKVAGWFGTVLKICPLLNVDLNGKLIAREKVRGKSNVIKRIVDKMQENADGGLDYNDRCYICNSDCMEDAEAVKSLIEERFHNLKGKVRIYSIGTTIGSHTGPGTVAIFFFGKERKD
ncbi:MAG: DegV family protein [Clostridia bacterium]|nr:DegV family protein [Clostridia bacterium]